MKFNSFKEAKESIGKAVRKVVGIASIATITIGTAGQSTEAFSQTIDNKDTITALSHYKDSAFAYKGIRVSPIIHQYEVWSKNTDTIPLNFNEIRNEIKDLAPIQCFIVRAVTSFDPNEEISLLDSWLVSYSAFIHIESFEVKHAYGANATKFKIKITNDKEITIGAAPPLVVVFISDTAILRDIVKFSGLYYVGRSKQDINNWDFQNDFISFSGSLFDMYKQLNKLILFVNKRYKEKSLGKD